MLPGPAPRQKAYDGGTPAAGAAVGHHRNPKHASYAGRNRSGYSSGS